MSLTYRWRFTSVASASYDISGNQLFRPIAMEGKNKEGGYNSGYKGGYKKQPQMKQHGFQTKLSTKAWIRDNWFKQSK